MAVKWQKWNTIAQFIIAVLIFFTVYFTFISIKQQGVSIKQQGEFNRQSLRPYVGIMEIRSERKTDGNLAIALLINNKGRVPANEINIQVLPEMSESTKVMLRGVEVDVSKIRIIKGPFPTSLFPQQLHVSNFTFGGNNMPDIYSGKKPLILEVDITYCGLIKIPKKDYGYYLKMQYNPARADWDVLNSKAW